MDPSENPDDGRNLYENSPFGGDEPDDTHYQPAPPLKNMGGGLPGEQQDPRFC